MTNKLAGYVTFTNPDGGISQTFGPDDELPSWADEQVTDAHTADPESDADLPVAGPGQVAGEGLSDEDKAAAKRKAEAKRKADQRAATKQKAEAEAAAVKAAEEAEAKRTAEAEAAAQGGGS